MKDAMAGLLCIQTICFLLWDTILSVWTWLCISWVGFLRDCYLAPQCTLWLLWPLKTLCHGILVFLDQLTKLGNSGWAIMPDNMYFCWHVQIFFFFFKSVVFGALVYFWILWLFESLYIGLDRLIWCTLVHGNSHKKKAPEIILAWFWHGT